MSNHNNQGLKLIKERYLIKKKISQGSFGVVYVGEDITLRQYVAIKVEKDFHEDSSLDREAEILNQLRHISQVPKLYFSGKEQDSNVLVLQFLGRDLTHYMKIFRKFSLKCVLNIAEQMLTIIENIHKHKVIHRDIKPENILVGREDDSSLLYLVDFGISKFYKDDMDNHISYKDHQPFIGTTRYASISAHKGQALSRKDDLESLGYMLIFLLKGQLPWQNLQFTNEQDKIKQVGLMKMTLDINELCKGIPSEFGRFIDYVKGLPFKQEPNYKYCQQLFSKLAGEHNFQQKDLIFDWEQGGSKQEPSINKIDSKQQIKRRRNEEHSSIHSQINSDMEMNSLLRTPEQKKSNLTPDLRRKSRLVSVSSYNSTSNVDFNNSVMLGIQPSMLSRLSKQSFNSNSAGKHNSQVNIYQKSKYIQKLLGQDNETIKDFSLMNDSDDGVSAKYLLLKQISVKANFKRGI